LTRPFFGQLHKHASRSPDQDWSPLEPMTMNFCLVSRLKDPNQSEIKFSSCMRDLERRSTLHFEKLSEMLSSLWMNRPNAEKLTILTRAISSLIGEGRIKSTQSTTWRGLLSCHPRSLPSHSVWIRIFNLFWR
jgi:hypothetical protein